jgi:hypothetical protein
MLMERVDYNLRIRWVVSLNMDDQNWDVGVYQETATATRRGDPEAFVDEARTRQLPSIEHDGRHTHLGVSRAQEFQRRRVLIDCGLGRPSPAS